ncbi:MAG: radical SAM family heme chaperone HemW [Firmicutes bacterium]|nr:radical SAM family heme chaperone HemW [Bacillota bacterium]
MVGLYVHVPFCERRCHYCDFNTYLLRDGGVDEYLWALEREAELYGAVVAERKVAFDTVFVGGGTPTVLDACQLGRLFAAVRSHLPVREDAEVTVEANPGTLTGERLKALRDCGVNRISLGVQSLNDALLERLGRIHSARDARNCYDRARAMGFHNINIDLMFGLPGQDAGDWRKTLAQVIEWQPEHVSCYSLIVEEGTPFGRLYAQGQLPLPGEDEELSMYKLAIDLLAAAGYRHYEISNWSRPGFESRHNCIYWLNGQWLGLGPGAHSQWAGERFANVRLPREYWRRLARGERPVGWREPVSREVEQEDTVILGLRLRDGVDGRTFQRRFGVALEEVFGREVGRLLEMGMVEWRGHRLRLTERGLPVANRAFEEFIRTPGQRTPA